MSQLTQIIGLFYRMQDADTRALEEQILTARKRAWELSLRELAAAQRCNRTPNAPSGEDLRELKRMSRDDAKSVSQTYNRDLERKIQQLYDANPRGNRTYYASNLEKWVTERARWKDSQIALHTEQSTRDYAQRRFYDMNNLSGKNSRYIFQPRSAVCKECTRLIGMGVVGQSTVDRYGNEQHVGCVHEWVRLNDARISCRDLWIG